MAKNTAAADEFETAGASFENNDDGVLVDLSNVQAQSFDPLPKGNYNGIIEDVEYQLSKSSGKPMWNIRVSVTDEEYENRKIFTFLSFSEKALPGTKAALAVIAPELLATAFNPKDPDVIAALVTKPVKLKVDIEKNEEHGDRNRVKKWLATEGSDGF
jgi:hypothetical protein